ncbi:hypothetical protein [Brunnivagina elsteri]|uniref:hypothetical protein n=1 Tax=Brunnivagina elsteri TaxID=1247191 RepID=UPI0011785240|nr:hypothetical protein [Calothrix elsteri]
MDDADKPPTIPKVVLNRYISKQTWVFDAANVCLGRIVKGQFISKYKSSTTCKELPNGIRQ